MKESSKGLDEAAVTKLVAQIATTKNDVARFKLVRQLCDGADEARLVAVDAAFRRDKKRLPAYPFVLGVLLDGGVSRAASVLAELVENTDEATAASALEVVWAKELADGMLDVIIPIAAGGKLGARRTTAIKALTSARSDEATAVLVKLAAPGALPDAQRCVVFRGLAQSDNPGAMTTLHRAFEDFGEHPVVRTYAAYGVARAGDVRGLYALRSNLELSDPGTLIQTVLQSLMAVHKLVEIPERAENVAMGAAGPTSTRLRKEWPQILLGYEKRWRAAREKKT